MFDDESNDLIIKYSYWHGYEPISRENDGTYADEDAEIKNRRSYEWQNTISDVLNRLIAAGLRIEEVKEYPQLPWRYVKKAVKSQDGSWLISGDPYRRCGA